MHNDKEIIESLRALPVEPAQSGFAKAALRHAKRVHQPQHQHWFVVGFSSAMAMSLILALFLGVFTNGTDLPTVNVTVNGTHKVKLFFTAQEELTDVTFSMQLPEEFELAGHAGKRELTWQSTLYKGRNVLTLPIIAKESGKGELVARLTHADKVKIFRLRLVGDTKKPETSTREIIQHPIG